MASLPMNPSENSVAFGAPGIEPRWTSSAKEGVGTAYHTSCRLWFTLSHGIVNEIYYPHVDHPVEYPERDCPFYRLTNSDPQGRYRIIKQVLTDPHRSVLLMHTKLEVLDEALRGKLSFYA